MKSLARASVLLCVGSMLSVTGARAHESAATSPEFEDPPCITVIDRNAQPVVEFEYSVPLDDVELEEGDIRVADAKTHQFFAFRGAMFPRGFAFELYDFDDRTGEPILLPEWISIADAKRAANASSELDGTGFSESDVPPGTTLDDVPGLDGRWLRITADDARVPITMEQAEKGFAWDVCEVEPDIYTVTGFVWSPPYNAWAPRDGLVVVTDGELHRPVGQLDSVDEFLFSYQGRRVQGCLEVPEGTTVDGYFRIEERPEEGWLPWLEQEPAQSGRFELCFNNPRPELTGSARVRLDLTAPDGEGTSIYSRDTATSLSGDGECVETDTFCCDFEAAPLAAGDAAGDGDGDGVDADPSAAGSASDLADDADAGEGAAGEGGPADEGGCSVAAAGRGGLFPSLFLLGVALAWACRRRR